MKYKIGDKIETMTVEIEPRLSADYPFQFIYDAVTSEIILFSHNPNIPET